MKTTVLLHADEIARVLDRLACQIMERHGDCEQTVLLGIQRRGVDLAVRLGKVLSLIHIYFERPFVWARERKEVRGRDRMRQMILKEISV